MSELTLSDIQRFHADLLTIRSAGVELEFECRQGASLGIDASTVEALRSSLFQIEANLAAATARGASVDSLLEATGSLRLQYVASLRTWQSTGQLPISFEPMVAIWDEAQQYRGAQRISTVQPILWLVASYFALLSICLVTATSFLQLTEDMRMEPGPVLAAVLAVRDWMPVWIWAAPIAILAGAWSIWSRRPASRTNPSRSQNFLGCGEVVRRAILAEQSANFLQQGISLDQAIDMLGAGGAGTIEKTPLPPLLKWAASQQQAGLGIGHVAQEGTRARMLLAASIYRGIASVTALQQRKLASTRLSHVLLGGLLVLCVSLCVFGPLIELLYSLANANGG